MSKQQQQQPPSPVGGTRGPVHDLYLPQASHNILFLLFGYLFVVN